MTNLYNHLSLLIPILSLLYALTHGIYNQSMTTIIALIILMLIAITGIVYPYCTPIMVSVGSLWLFLRTFRIKYKWGNNASISG